MAKLLYRPEAAAECLDLGRSAVYELIRTGRLRSVKVGRARRIPADALTEYVAGLVTEQGPREAA